MPALNGFLALSTLGWFGACNAILGNESEYTLVDGQAGVGAGRAVLRAGPLRYSVNAGWLKRQRPCARTARTNSVASAVIVVPIPALRVVELLGASHDVVHAAVLATRALARVLCSGHESSRCGCRSFVDPPRRRADLQRRVSPRHFLADRDARLLDWVGRSARLDLPPDRLVHRVSTRRARRHQSRTRKLIRSGRRHSGNLQCKLGRFEATQGEPWTQHARPRSCSFSP